MATTKSGLFYAERGDPSARAVVFLHGFPFSHALWDAQLEVVGGRWRAIAYDLRGHGASDPGDGQYTIDGHADDLFALLDELGLARPVVVGLSMGGYVALRALERDAGRFSAAVLCDTRSEADPDEARLRRFAAMRAVKRDGSTAFAESFVKAVFAPESFARHPGAVAKIGRIIAATPPARIAANLLALASRTDTTGALPRLALPVLVMVGEHDALTPPAAARALHERIPGSELCVVPAAAHMSNLENAPLFNATLLAFLARLP